jgi:hypothetical protein
MTFQSRCRLLLLVHLAVFISVAVRSQQKNDTLTQLLDYSRPGEAHQRLAAIEGSWNFQDARRAYVKGVLIRKAIFEGRFYSVEITGGKLPLPVANGIMKEDNYRSLQWEGYDNARKIYITTSINNHIGSNEEIQQGSYDSAAHAFTYQWESELLPGYRVRNKRIVHLADPNTYTEEYFEERNHAWVKVRELRYVRQPGN